MFVTYFIVSVPKTIFFIYFFFSVASEDFRMFVTDYYDNKIVCMDSRGSEIFNISILFSAMSIAIDMFDKAAVSPSIVYSDSGAIYRMNMDGSNKEKLLDTTFRKYIRHLIVPLF